MPETKEPIPIPIKKIQEVAGVKTVPAVSGEKVYDAEKFSPQEQAEHLWGFYTDYRRQEAEIRQKAVGPDGVLRKQWETVAAEREKLVAAREKCGYFYQGGKLFVKAGFKPADTDVKAYQAVYSDAVGARNQFDRQLLGLAAKNPNIQDTIRKIQVLWSKPETQKIFRAAYAAAEKQKLEQRKSTAEYGFLKQHLRDARDRFFGLLRTKYVNGRVAPMTLEVNLSLAEEGLEAVQAAADGMLKPEELTRENTDRAALAKYQDLREYARDFQTKGFIWSPSRLRILDRITKHLANMVPTMMVGEAGTGKTQLARTAAILLQGEYPRSVTGAPFSSAKAELVGLQEMEAGGKTKWTFGELVAAATGFQDSDEIIRFMKQLREKAVRAVGRIIFIDEANLFDPGALEAYLKPIVGLRPGETFRMGALPGVLLRMADRGFGMVLAINPADARYDDRRVFPPSLERLFRAGRIEVDYPEMEIGEVKDGRQENKGELFDMLLASLLTRDGRLPLAPPQLQPVYKKTEVDAAAGTHTMIVDMDKQNFLDFSEEEAGRGGARKKVSKEPSHGALFRFALLVRATNDLFSEKKVTLPGESRPLTEQDKLTYTVLDLGVVMTWMRELGGEAGIDLNYELWQRLAHFATTIPKTAGEDLRVFKKLCAAYGFDMSLRPEERVKPYSQVLTAKEIGYLSPEVARPILQKGEELGPKNKAFFDEQGNQHLIDVNRVMVEWEGDIWGTGSNERREFSEGTDVEVKFGGTTRNLKFLGVDQKNGWAVFSEDRATILNPMQFPRERFESMVKSGEIKKL